MILPTPKILSVILASIILVVASSCDAFSPPPTPTATATNTPLPTNTLVPTNTPLPPTATFTETPLPIPTSTPIPFTPPPPLPTATIALKDQIRVYYIDLENSGQFGCNEDVYWFGIGVKRSEDVVADLKLALYRLLTYYQPYYGDYYHAGYASQLAVGEVSIDANRTAFVNITGTYVPTKEPCDAPRFRDQIKMTIKQFPLVRAMVITINGHPIGDVMSRNK